MTTVLVTGGAGFIGGNFVLGTRNNSIAWVITLDRLTCADNLMNLESLRQDPDPGFIAGGIGDRATVRGLFVSSAVPRRWSIPPPNRMWINRLTG